MTKPDIFTNEEKKRHGDNMRNSLGEVLDYCKKCNYILDYDPNIKVGRPDYKDQKQFLIPYLVKVSETESWALYTTTSYRSDRVKGQQWDAFNVKAIIPEAKHAFLVFPDNAEERDKVGFKGLSKRIRDAVEYSAIDDILTFDELTALLEVYHLRGDNVGTIKDVQGRSFEAKVAAALSSSGNLKHWKKTDKLATTSHYDIFECVVNGLKLDSSKVSLIQATNDQKIIGLLATGGKPKTDVLVKVVYNDKTENYLSISCKRSSMSSVSVHEYSADAFSAVLDPDNQSLNNLLNMFQKNPSLSGMGPKNCEALKKELSPYIDRLAMWVLGGYGGQITKSWQVASHILLYSNESNDISCYSILEYYKHLLNSGIKGHFGTVFSWTYPSKKRGKAIQLKCKIL